MSISPSAPLSPAWMSWWDRYLAPGDLRRRNQLCAPPTRNSTRSNHGTEDTTAPPAASSTLQYYNDTYTTRLDHDHRHRRQNALFLGGLTFTLLSFALTRRTILRKRIAGYPATFTPSHMHIAPPPGPQQQMSRVEGSLLAIEALGLATVNVVSVFMAGIGGAMVWFDVAEPEDLRRSVVVGDGGVVDVETEREVEGWIAGAFGGGQKAEGLALGGEGFRNGVMEKLDEVKREKEGSGTEDKR